MAYITIPIETDEDANASSVFDFIASRFPGWTPSEGQLDVWIILALARLAADLKDQAANVSDDIFRYFGPMLGVTPFDDVPAQAMTNWVLTDNAGHTITAGTRVGVLDDNLDTHEFTVGADIIVPAGTTVANGVSIVASNAGISENGIGNAGSQAVPLDGTVWVSTITMVGPTSGGQDAEDDPTYLGRLSSVLQTMTPRPILPNDFAILARDIAGVVRSTAIDGYNPANGTYNNERMVDVIVADVNGNALASSVKTSVQTYLDGLREVNFVVNVGDPNYTTIHVRWDVNMWTGNDATALASDINAAIQGFLNPATWGVPPGGDPTAWYNRPVVKVNDLISVVGNVLGVKDVNTLTISTDGVTFGTTDITMTGAAPLPLAGTTSGTVH